MRVGHMQREPRSQEKENKRVVRLQDWFSFYVYFHVEGGEKVTERLL